MSERVGSRWSRFRLWLQLDVDRLWLTVEMTIVFFVFLLLFSQIDAVPLRRAMGHDDPVDTVTEEYVSALITGVTLIVTISQLVISQETGPLGDQRNRMRGAMDFREEVEDFFGSISPPEPSSFLQALIDMSKENAEALGKTVSDSHDEDMKEETNQFIDSLIRNAETVSDDLENAQFGRYQVVKSALDYNYSWKVYQARRLRDDHANSLTEEQAEAFNDLIRVLLFFGPAREHIKTLFFQWELAGLSRRILYISLPALAFMVATLLFIDQGSYPGAVFGIDNMTWITSAVLAFGSMPIFLLAAYILRLATIARRTLSIGPFILRETERTADIDWKE